MPPSGNPSLTSTQFTQTQPHATSKQRPTKPASSAPNPTSRHSQYGPAPPGETPQQKVERLRAAARRARLEREYNPVEEIIRRGRTWADVAHRTAAWTLIGATGLSAVIIAYSAYDLVGYNRRQRRLFLDREMQKLQDAYKAAASGTASAAQLELIRKEKLTQEEEAIRARKEKGFFRRGKEWLFSGLESGKDEVVATTRPGDGEFIQAGAVDAGGEGFGILEKVEEIVERDREASAVRDGGPLDRMGEKLGGRMEQERKGWWGWVWRKGNGDGAS